MFAIDPPIVPLFRTWGSPIPSASNASEGIFFFISFDWATSTCLVVAPILTVFPDALIPERLLIFFKLIISFYEASPNFIEGNVVIPPAKNAEFDDDNFDASLTSFAEW